MTVFDVFVTATLNCGRKNGVWSKASLYSEEALHCLPTRLANTATPAAQLRHSSGHWTKISQLLSRC
ncbi:hypothetical protein IG631_10896 [Alternaria alternata]|nr:hypothetical protein IG631_10896 [Alternaria alternata]